MFKFDISFFFVLILLFNYTFTNSEITSEVFKYENGGEGLPLDIVKTTHMKDYTIENKTETSNTVENFDDTEIDKKYDKSHIVKDDRYSSRSIYFILAGILIIISIFSTFIVRDCVVERIRLKNDFFLQTVMDTVFRQATCIFLSLAISYCLLTSRLIDLIREYCEKIMLNYSNKTIINNIATKIDDAIINNSKVWTTENLTKEFNNILAIVILTFSWYCVFVLLFTASVKFLEKWIRYADSTDVGSLIKSIYTLKNMFSLGKIRKKKTSDCRDYYSNGNNNSDIQKLLGELGKNGSNVTASENKGSIQENIPITVLQGCGSISSYKLPLSKNGSLSERGQIETDRLIDVEKNEVMNYSSEVDIEQCTDINSSLSSCSEREEGDISIVEDDIRVSQFNDSIELGNKPNNTSNTKSKRDSVSSRKKKQIRKASNIPLTWRGQISEKFSLFFNNIRDWPNQFLLTYMKAHFVSLRYDFMDEIATYDNYGSFSSNVSGDTCSSLECQNNSWLISLADPTVLLVAGVYFTEYLRAKLLILAVSLIRIPITTLVFAFTVNIISWLCIYNYHYNIVAFNNTKHYFSEPMICFYISVVLFGFSLVIWLESWIIKRNLQPKDVLEYLKMKYSLDIGIPQQEIEYEKIMPRYKIRNAKLSKKKESMSRSGGYFQLSTQPGNLIAQGTFETNYLGDCDIKESSSFLKRLYRYIYNKLFGTNNPTLHDDLFFFKKNGPNILLRWFQASYFLQHILISIVIHLSYLQKELWFKEFQLVTVSIWCIFILQNMCLPFILYPILLCTSVGQMADKLVLEQVISIQKTQNIQRIAQISESLRFYSFIYLFTRGNEEDKELQRRKYSIVAKTAPWELQVRCRNTMNFLINNAPIKTQTIVTKSGIDEHTIKYFLISEGLYYSSEHAKELLTVFDFDNDGILNESEFSICYHAIQQHFMGELDVSIILNYLESNFGVNTASSTGIDLSTFTSMVKKLKLGWSNGQIRHAMIFLSGGRNPTSMYHSVNSLKKSDSKRKNKYQLSVKVNDFINKLVTIESGIPSSISSTQLRSGTLVPLNEKSSILSSFSRNSNSDKKGSIISNSNCIKEEQHKNTDKIQIEEYVYSHSELEEEIIERV